MRRLSRRNTLNLVKELDAFPKVPESYVKTSAFGGTGKFSQLPSKYNTDISYSAFY